MGCPLYGAMIHRDKLNKCRNWLKQFAHCVCHRSLLVWLVFVLCIFTSGERRKLALINKAGSYFAASFPQVEPYKTKIVWVRNQAGQPAQREANALGTTEVSLEEAPQPENKAPCRSLSDLAGPPPSPAHAWGLRSIRQGTGGRWRCPVTQKWHKERDSRGPEGRLGLRTTEATPLKPHQASENLGNPKPEKPSSS